MVNRIFLAGLKFWFSFLTAYRHLCYEVKNLKGSVENVFDYAALLLLS